MTNDYPDAFSSHEARENLKRLSNIDAIRGRLEEAAKEKENIISQRLQEYLKSQANNLSSLVANLLRELESEKNRIKDADLNKISEQLKEYEKLSDKIEINFKEEYDTFVLNFIKDIKNRLNNALKEAAQTASDGIKEKEKNPERVAQDGFWGDFKRFWGGVFGKDWGYESGIKAGAVIDFLKAMNKDCEDALNDQVKSFKIDFRKELYAKVLPILREIINDESLIDEIAFKKSVHAVTDKIKFEEFDHTDIPSEIEGQTGFLKGDEAKQFIESVESYVRGFEDKTQTDVKNYCTYLEEKLGEQDFANGVLSKLKKDTQNLQNQVQNKAQSLTQYGVIACVLNAKMENKGLEEYQCILDNNLLEFASGVDSLKEKEIALLELQEIKKELQLVASYPSLFQKNMVAVGGGFSTGKSTFLNHLLGLNLKLSANSTPTTAIPTYCLKGEREVLMGVSQNGGMVELPDFSFDHKTLNAFGFDLKSIMPFMLLSAPSVPFEFLCFIDTPWL